MAEQQSIEVENQRANAGADLLMTLPTPAPASAELDRVMAEIPAAYGITAASPIFLALAHWPDFLVPAWDAWRPLIDTPAYRAAVATIVSPAIPVSARATPTRPELVDYLALQRSLLPELLFLASTWYRAANGLGASDAPRAERAPARAVRSPGLAAGDPTPETESALAAIAAAHGHPRVLSPYRMIAADAPFLIEATPALLEAIASPEYASARQGVLDAAANAARTLDMPAIPSSDEGPAQILALFRNRMIPPLILDTALFTSMAEPTRTTETP